MIEAAFLQCRADKSWNPDLWQITSCHCNTFTVSFRPTSLFVHQRTFETYIALLIIGKACSERSNVHHTETERPTRVQRDEMHYLRPWRLLRTKLNEYLVQRLPCEQIHASPGVREPVSRLQKKLNLISKRGRIHIRELMESPEFARRPTSLLLARSRRTIVNHRDSMERGEKRFRTKGCALHCKVRERRHLGTRASSRAVFATTCR